MGDTNRLRAARLAAGLTLGEMAERTRISPAMLRHIDEGRFDRLPAGIYARAWVKSYAQAVGLDAAAALGDVADALPVVDEWREKDDAGALPAPGSAAAPAAGIRTDAHTPFPAMRIEPLVTHAGGTPLVLRRLQAAVIDTALLAGISASLAAITLGAASSTPAMLTAIEAAALATTIAAIAAAYFVIFAGIGHGTPGAQAAGLADAAETTGRPLQLEDIARRAWAAFHAEASVVLDLAFEIEWGGIRRRLDA